MDYHFHPETGELLGSSPFDESPLDPGTYLHPANSTTNAPPEAGEGQIAVFIGGEWSLAADHRGETWFREDGAGVVVSSLGDPAESGLTSTAPTVPPDMDAARKAAHAEAWRYGEAIIARELGNWTSAEQLSWDLQKAESETVIGGGTLLADALIPGLAEDKGVTLDDYALSVLEYAARFQQITRAAVKLRRDVGVLLSEDLDTPAKLEAAVADLKAQADAIAAQLIGA